MAKKCSGDSISLKRLGPAFLSVYSNGRKCNAPFTLHFQRSTIRTIKECL